MKCTNCGKPVHSFIWYEMEYVTLCEPCLHTMRERRLVVYNEPSRWPVVLFIWITAIAGGLLLAWIGG